MGPITTADYERLGISMTTEGRLILEGPSARLLRGIAAHLKRFARELGADEIILPGTVMLEDLKRSRYLARFPQILELQTSFALEENGALKPPDRACCSAICLPLYPHLGGQRFASEETRTFTAEGRAFRAESKRSLERLTEFNMREVIFFGAPDFVNQQLEKCVEWLKSLLSQCELRGAIQTAEDPFYCAEAETLRLYQRAARSKLELVLEKPETRELIAVASVNWHESHFAKAYDIQFAQGDFVHSGCFGLGFERFLLLMIAQHGTDLEQWPRALNIRLREDVF